MATPAHNLTTEEEEQARYFLAVQSLSAPLKYAHIVYNLLLDKAVEEEIAIPLVSDVIKVPVFRGKLSDVYEESGASKAYYSGIRKALVESGSIYILEKGNVHYPSVVAVDVSRRPPLEDSNVKSPSEGLTIDAGAFTLLDRRVQKIEAAIAEVNIVQALSDMEKRLAKIEKDRS